MPRQDKDSTRPERGRDRDRDRDGALGRRDGGKGDLEEKVVAINAVSKTVKGGRSRSFSALVVVGDRQGKVGVGLGKAREVSDAIRKGVDDAKKNMMELTMVGTTIPHQVIGEFGAGMVLMRPAPRGTGVIAGGPVRAVLELGGVKDITTKSLGSSNPINMVRATVAGLKSLRKAEDVARMRGKSVEEIL